MSRPASPRLGERVLSAVCLGAVLLPLLALGVLLLYVLLDALPRLTATFVSGYPSRVAEQAGILPGLVGSLYLLLLCAAFALPLGVGAAVYLEEYDAESRLSRLVELNLGALAGVPSVIYGLLGLAVFVRAVGLGRSLVAGAATLALLVLPIVIISAREALRAVPRSLREASLSLGATRWQTTWRVTLPTALPSILTGAVLALSRAMGETAPLVVVGALTYVTFLPDGLDAPFTALPIQIFSWVSRPQPEFLHNAAAGIVALLALLVLLNLAALWLRARLERRAA
ncbi:MAG: phosphate ABC transporter permease PstA [Deltaproteobacteria bacterium]|nr:phosphate ABC transporter permease PstA [Deltaproteobacteria bacterium]